MIILNNNLRVFITAAELCNLTETAKKLYISQPAVSQAIRKLEDELNVRLFIRNKRSSLTLTEVGKDVLSLAYKLTDLENRLYQRVYEENHLMGGLIRIASVPLGVSLILSYVLPVFKSQFPGVQVELMEGAPLEVKNMVSGHQADLGITTSPYMGLAHRFLMTDTMVSINRDCDVTIDLRNENPDLILCRVARDSISEQLVGQKIDLSRSLIVEAASTQINLIEQGNGKGVISERMLSTIPNSLIRGRVTPVMDREISLVSPDFDELTAAAKELSEMILQRAQQLSE